MNAGTLGAAGNATNLNVRAFPGALAGTRSVAQFFDGTARTVIPWQAALNPPNDQPFTVEAWLWPASDQIQSGQAALNNRFSYPGVDRQGWVVFQRAPDDSYAGRSGFEGVGWNFRMYRGAGGSSGLDVTSGRPFEVGQWAHMVVVYDPADAAEGGQPSLTMYIDGTEAAKNVWTGDGPGYVANTDDHDPEVAVRGPAGISLGAYNNTEPGSNPYFGAVDEFALYAKKLTPAEILAHYQSGTNAARATPHADLILAQQPAAYLRLEEPALDPAVAINLGDTRAAGHGANTEEGRHAAPGALAGPARPQRFPERPATTPTRRCTSRCPSGCGRPRTASTPVPARWPTATSSRATAPAGSSSSAHPTTPIPACPASRAWGGTSACSPAAGEAGRTLTAACLTPSANGPTSS